MGFTILDSFRLPEYPDASLNLDRNPLSIVDNETFNPEAHGNDLTVPIGLATILHYWCPDALAAFLDFDAWFSMTLILSLQEGEPSETKIEIGRVGNQITFGALDATGDNWTLMLTYNVALEGEERGAWIANPKESMEGERDVVDVEEIERLGRAFVKELVEKKRWQTGKKIKHRFFVEYAPMDIWGDGIPMNPHWLYKSLDLSTCTSCRTSALESSAKSDNKKVSLQRCGRCGTATYCSDTCQRADWAVHKNICNMSMEDRGQALKITEKGGLINWDPTKTMVEEGSQEESDNPNFAEPQLKRARRSHAPSPN